MKRMVCRSSLPTLLRTVAKRREEKEKKREQARRGEEKREEKKREEKRREDWKKQQRWQCDRCTTLPARFSCH